MVTGKVGRGRLALDDRALRHATHRHVIERHTRTAGSPGAEASDDDGSLSHCVDVSIGPIEGGLNESAAEEAAGIAEGAHRDVDARAGVGERRQRRGDDHGSCVLCLDLGRVEVRAEAPQHSRRTLYGETRLPAVAGAVETDDQPIAGELIGRTPRTSVSSSTRVARAEAAATRPPATTPRTTSGKRER